MSLKYADLSDESLVMLTLAGEQTAYEALVVRYQKAVISAAASVTRNAFMAEDAAQDAFVAAWMKLNLLREPEKYRFWVCRIAKNCAKNMVSRYRSYLSLDETGSNAADDAVENWYVEKEERAQLHESIGRLPQKIREIIRLHYFEGLSIAEIAEKTAVSAGTVKSQLYDGRKKLRKEMDAMDETMNDTWMQRVMKKVTELKNWQFSNSKNGFETVYADVLADAEKLPESKDKYHVLADVLLRGWWWLPGEQNDALFARIREAAERGRNDEVMQFIALREASQYWSTAKIEFIRDKQIPRLRAGGFRLALASEWYELGNAYFENGKREEGFAAYQEALNLLAPSDPDYAKALAKNEAQKIQEERFAQISNRRFRIQAVAEELRLSHGTPRRYNTDWECVGSLWATEQEADMIFRNASLCDGLFAVAALRAGEVTTGSDGTTLSCLSRTETVSTPAGVFEGCQLWETVHESAVCRTYYREGVGIVKQERTGDGMTEVRVLKSYTVTGGGLIPCAAGNTWEYEAPYDPSVKEHTCRYTVCFADDGKAILSGLWSIHRLRYDENCWLDMIEQIRGEYWDGKKCCDVSFAMQRAQALAATPLEKAHTAAACSVARRILQTNPAFNPDYTETGHWNFFARSVVASAGGTLRYSGNFRWSFELKNTDGSTSQEPLLYNDILGILQDAAGCVWSEDWRPGACFTEKHLAHGTPIRTEIDCEACPSVTTKAGSFENCLKLSLRIRGFREGMSYRGGEKEYYFAPGVGIVRCVHHYGSGTMTAVYELTAYEGTGEGYMPLAGGMMRRYDALELMDGYTASAVYTCAEDENGRAVILEDRCGIRKKPERITQYSTVYGETVEEQLWEAGKREESRLRHAVNNLHLLLHFLCRPSRYWAAPKKAVAWNQYRIKLLEGLGSEGVPSAWTGLYASTCFRTACAQFGCGRKEEGYETLDRALELIPAWSAIPDGTLLEVGDPLIFGGVRIVKGKALLELPDGSREPLPDYAWDIACDRGLAYYGMSAPHGWEWFNSVRNEARYQAALEKAKEIAIET